MLVRIALRLYFWSLSTPTTNVSGAIGDRMPLPFRILKVQNDGHLHFIEALPTLDNAKARVKLLGELWAGDYVIDDEGTGQRVFISTGDESKN